MTTVSLGIAMPLIGAAPAQAAPPTNACNTVYSAQIIFWAMTCSRPGQPVIGGFATWRNVPITYDQVSADATVQTANYLRVTPNTESSEFDRNIEIGLYAEKTGKTTQTYGPRWTELGKSGGRTKAITAGVNPSKPDNRNHTYMLVRQATGNQWDVLYDFNTVGSTTDQLKVIGGNTNRVDVGLEVMGPQYTNVPTIANRMQFMDGNQSWHQVATNNVAKVISLPTCSSTDKPPYCFNSKLTDNTNFTQWTVSKPRKPAASVAATQAADDPTSWASLLETEGVPATFNGVDQKALTACLDQDPDSCLQTVPGLSECVQTAQVCNAVALQAKPQAMAARTVGDTPSAESLRERAAHSFAVDPQHVDLTRSSTTAVRALDAGTATTWTVSSRQMTPGLEHDHRRYRGFTAVYSAQTGQLLEACWGEMCRS
ncbi:hypothetical protein RKE30_33620 [Streptomyces sp. Li-HN-5-11]|uniref:hypothetical protein n=1 Tax=Streptomyces sp. Li-HN-5-11 TaxID=3075432 RepID=UPI0028A69EFF|nr:hypothetical protein [Streptomyces sp. Li-HN-5-11]WNM34963.1 hypothetical protein RKE30_33620 [Streptomyces sp. Li-HN-5-11]